MTVDKLNTKKAITHLNTSKSIFLGLNSRFFFKITVFLGQNTLSAFQKLADVRLKKEK